MIVRFIFVTILLGFISFSFADDTKSEVVKEEKLSATSSPAYTSPNITVDPDSSYAKKTMEIGKPKEMSEGHLDKDCPIKDSKGRCVPAAQGTFPSSNGTLKFGDKQHTPKEETGDRKATGKTE